MSQVFDKTFGLIMSDADTIIDTVNNILNKLDSNIVLKLNEWGKIVQLSIDEKDFFIDFKENMNLKLKNGSIEHYDFKLITSSSIFNQIINNEINPVEAVVSGEVTIDGSLTDALEFSEIMTSSN